MNTVEMKPTWKTAMRILFAVFEHGTPEGKRLARLELMELAEKLDAVNQGKAVIKPQLKAGIVC